MFSYSMLCVSVSGSDGNSICFVEVIIKQTCKAVTWQNASQHVQLLWRGGSISVQLQHVVCISQWIRR